MNQCTTSSDCTGLATAAPPREFRPHVESRSAEGGLVLEVDLPGANEKNLDLELDGGVLTVTAPRLASQAPGDSAPAWGEIDPGVFKRSFRLPDHLDLETIDARLELGVLTITFLESPAVSPKKIEVKAS